jgi:8-oxo-dGTP diphosphatase
VKLTEVAAAVIERPDGSFLLGQRAADTFYPGYWEFPGGKVEPGETAGDALVRELREELGIEVHHATPWLMREHVYEHAHVRLHFFRVRDWSGELTDHVHSALAWQHPGATTVAPMLPANAPVLAALALPDFYGISQAADLGVERQLTLLEQALAGGLRLVQVREPRLAPTDRAAFARAALALCRQYGARLLINSDVVLAAELGADGVHLTARQLAVMTGRPDLPLVGASCHDAAELRHAALLGADFAVFGPVLATASHPGEPGLGWAEFRSRIRGNLLPVYAIGGLDRDDMAIAQAAGAHGVAAIRSAWTIDR